MGKEITELATFVQHQLPGLEVGEYAIEVQNKFQGEKVSGEADTTDKLTYRLGVSGPRFRMDPTMIHGVFPPRNSFGEFSNVLPHIALNKLTFPWQRDPCDENHTPIKGFFSQDTQEYDLDVPTWLAVLLLNPKDYEGTSSKLQIESVLIRSLFGKNASENPSFLSPASGEDPDNQPPWIHPDSYCNAINIPTPLFSKIAPSMADLFTMASVRKVAMDKKAIAAEEDTADLGNYSIIIGNRIPMTGQQNLAVLVSLENMQAFLPDANGQPSTAIPTSVKQIRLPVLASWQFVSKGDSFRFDHLLESLNEKQIDQPLPKPRLKIYPVSSTNLNETTAADKAIDLGYTPITHRTRSGEETVSWYRGPFTPHEVNGITVHTTKKNAQGGEIPAIFNADNLLRLNPDTGLFDTSYAAAWQLGRLLALQDKNFSVALYQWKRQMTDKLMTLLEDEVAQNHFGAVFQVLENAQKEHQKIMEQSTKKSPFPSSISSVTGPSRPTADNAGQDVTFEGTARQSLLEGTLALLAASLKTK